MNEMGRKNYSNSGRDQVNIGRVDGNVLLNTQYQLRPRPEKDLLETVRQQVEARLAGQLHHAIRLNLSKQTQPQQVRPWGMEVKVSVEQENQVLPQETTIGQVFDSYSGRLLILGEPGSGKTTSLLDLALELISRAEEDSCQRIPVIVDLSDWQPIEPQSISPWSKLFTQVQNFFNKSRSNSITESIVTWSVADWFVEKIRLKYGISYEEIKILLTDKKIIPLFDGLDEVRPECQEDCVRAVNQLLNSDLRPRQLAICCRREQYEAYSEKLELEGAVYLRDLTDDQINFFLRDVEKSDLWEKLTSDSKLLELIRRPLLLSISVIAYGELEKSQWENAPSAEKRAIDSKREATASKSMYL